MRKEKVFIESMGGEIETISSYEYRKRPTGKVFFDLSFSEYNSLGAISGILEYISDQLERELVHGTGGDFFITSHQPETVPLRGFYMVRDLKLKKYNLYIKSTIINKVED